MIRKPLLKISVNNSSINIKRNETCKQERIQSIECDTFINGANMFEKQSKQAQVYITGDIVKKIIKYNTYKKIYNSNVGEIIFNNLGNVIDKINNINHTDFNLIISNLNKEIKKNHSGLHISSEITKSMKNSIIKNIKYTYCDECRVCEDNNKEHYKCTSIDLNEEIINKKSKPIKSEINIKKEINYENRKLLIEEPLVNGITLYQYMKQKPNINLIEIKNIMLKSLLILYILHKNKLYHNDAHVDNFMIDMTGQITIIDYGSTTFMYPLTLRNELQNSYINCLNDIGHFIYSFQFNLQNKKDKEINDFFIDIYKILCSNYTTHVLVCDTGFRSCVYFDEKAYLYPNFIKIFINVIIYLIDIKSYEYKYMKYKLKYLQSKNIIN
jgi:serine/threonine protein kinase